MISDFDSKTWTDPWFMELSLIEKVLFIYLWTNSHKNVAGLYSLSPRTIAFETGISQNKIKACLETLFPKVYYDFQKNVVWVVNHVKHQFYKTGNISEKIVKHITKNLIAMKPHPFIDDFLEYYPVIQDVLNGKIDTVSIGDRYPIRKSGYPPGEGEGAGKGKDGGEGEGEGGGDNPFD